MTLRATSRSNQNPEKAFWEKWITMPQAIIMKPIAPIPASAGPVVSTKGSFEVTFQGFKEGQEIELIFWEVNEDKPSTNHENDTKIATLKGNLQTLIDMPNGPVLGMNVISNSPETTGPARIGFSLPIPKTSFHRSLAYNIPASEAAQKNEGAYWEIQAQIVDPPTESAVFSVARINRALTVRAGKNVATYNWHAGNEVTFYNDGSEDSEGTSGAFADMATAIDKAESFIFIADWSFHPYFRLHHKDPPTVDSTIGVKLINKARGNDKLLIAIHTWDHTVGAGDDQNDSGMELLDILAGGKGKRPANLLWRGSSRTGEGGGAGFGWSHHQKYVILDTPSATGRKNIKVFFGGLDLTKGRFNWPEHPINKPYHFQEKLPGQNESGKAQNYDDWYNAEFEGCKAEGDKTMPQQPWHDIHAMITGPTAWDVVREFVGRWNLDPTLTKTLGDKDDASVKKVNDKFTSLFEKDGDVFKFVLQFEEATGPWAAQVYRSIVKEHWGAKSKIVSPMDPEGEFRWTIDDPNVERSIQDAYLQAIGQAENFIYIESQYFIGSGKKWGTSSIANTVPEAIVNRINQHISNKHLKFHAYIVIPMFPEGDPSASVAKAQRQYEWKTIQFMIQLVNAKCDQINNLPENLDTGSTITWDQFLSFYFLANWDDLGVAKLHLEGNRKERLIHNPRYMIYVHSKLMIVDDRYVIIGSANLNERSLNGGRDTEICIGMWPATDKQAQTCVDQVTAFRRRLWLEHFGPNMETLITKWEDPQVAGAQAQVIARLNYEMMRHCRRRALPPKFTVADLGHICNWPFALDFKKNKMFVEKFARYVGKDFEHLPDGPDSVTDMGAWRLDPSFFTLAGALDLAE
jgi:phosphatidylserine/phosphatidylglycerophosphate/cardiolipin synthase-like enzyme